jgi:hypothetical protein
MDKMYEEGGLTTDGVDVDPISGNEVPPGSNAEEVRDDVDAKLSEGEYVVPADVVRYFGVGYFEKLRKKAKEALAGMEQDGRMGGEPMTAEEDLSPEEMDELTQVLNLNKGGYVKQYAEGGLETGDVQQSFLQAGMRPQTDWGQYSTPGSFVAANQQKATQQQQQQQVPVAASFVEYIGPNGQIMMVPVDANGNPTIPVPDGYKVKGAVTAQQDNDNDDGGVDLAAQRRAQEASLKRDNDWFDKFHAAEDPVAMAQSLLAETSGKAIPGLLGSVVRSADTLGDIGRIRGYAAAIEATNPDLAASLLQTVDDTIKDSNFGIKALESLIGSGKTYADMYSSRMADYTSTTPATTAATAATTAGAPGTTTSATGPSSTYTQTSSPNAQSAADSLGAMASNAGSSGELANIQRAQAIAQQSADTGQSIASIGQSVADTEEQQATDAAASAAGATGGAGGQWGMAKGGLVARPAKKAAAPKPKKSNKRGLGRK